MIGEMEKEKEKEKERWYLVGNIIITVEWSRQSRVGWSGVEWSRRNLIERGEKKYYVC